MIGGIVIALVCGAFMEQPGIVWADAASLDGRPVHIADAGTYSVWAKIAPGAPGTVTVGADTLTVESFDSAEGTGAQWVSLGARPLAEGDLVLKTSGAIVRLALADHPTFDPETSEAMLYAATNESFPRDARFDRVRDTDSTFAMTEFESKADWEAFAGDLRRTLLVGSGLWPLPERTPLNVHVEDVATHDDYIVSRVYFEASPGFYVTGNLFRPTGPGPFPGVLCPHGHWEHGRLEHGERGSVPARGITLARMGMVAFTYDMLGYNDSRQLHHRFEDQSESERKRLELWGIHPFALQLWSSIRAIDFIQALPYVDAENVVCTGASGGGTQTFALTGVDDRIRVAAPVNMISHSMQGGCICENSPLIRLRNSNMEVGALAAPRPMMMVSATGDWTTKTPEVEYPAIRGIYDLYDAGDRVANVHVDAGHNYNQQSREAVYRFFGKWVLDEGPKWESFSEPEAVPEADEIARVFPENATPEHDSGEVVLARLVEERRDRSAAALPKSAAELDAFRQDYGAALFDVTGVVKPAKGAVSAETTGSLSRGPYRVDRLVIARDGDRIPAVLYRPAADIAGSALIVHDQGKAALVDVASGTPGALVTRMLDAGRAVLAIDPFQTGENVVAESDRKVGKFPTTFLPTDTGYRIQDIVTALSYLRSRDDLGEVSSLIGLGDAGVWSLFASALDGAVPATVVDANGFDPRDDSAWMARHYLACVQSSGGVNAAAAMVAPRALSVFNTQGVFDLSPVAPLFGDMFDTSESAWSPDQIVDGL